MEQADLIWHNGELVAWEDAKVHVLTHGLHYGTGRVRGRARLRDRRRARRSSATTITSTRLFKSAELYYMPIPYTLEELRAADPRADRRQRAARVLHPPDRLPRLRPDGPVSRSTRRSRSRSRSGRGAPTSARRASGTGIRAKVSSWRRIPHDALIPHAKASGQYLNSVLAKIEASKAGYQEAILLDSHGFVCEGSGENIYVVRGRADPHAAADRRDPRRHQPQVDHPDRRATSAIEVVERDLARAELYLADEVFLSGTAAELVPGAGDRRSRDRQRRARADHARAPARVRRRAARPRPALRRVARRRRRCRLDGIEAPPVSATRPADDPRSSSTTRPCATACRGRACRSRRQEKLRVAHRLDELGIDLIEAGFPSSNPKELELFELLAGERFAHAEIAAFGMTRRRDVARRGRPGAARARRLLRAGVHARRQDLGAAPGEGRARSTARRTCG